MTTFAAHRTKTMVLLVDSETTKKAFVIKAHLALDSMSGLSQTISPVRKLYHGMAQTYQLTRFYDNSVII